jgi:hypothetical protein
MAYGLGILLGFLIGLLGPGEPDTGWLLLGLCGLVAFAPWFLLPRLVPFAANASYSVAYGTSIVFGLYRRRVRPTGAEPPEGSAPSDQP